MDTIHPAWRQEGSRPRFEPLGSAGRLLLVAAVPASLVWVPLLATGAGTIALSDAILLLLWATTAVHILVQGASRLDLDACIVALLPLLIAVLAGIGTSWSWADGRGLQEAMLFMKRFGLAAVIPLAASRLTTPGLTSALRVITVVAVLAMLGFVLFPELGDLLPRPSGLDYELAARQRATGLGKNPNDLAYTAVALSVLHAALLPRRIGALDRLLLVAVLAASAGCLVQSGSRSGVIGAVAALAFLVAVSGLRWRFKLALTAGAAATLVVGVLASPMFQQRMDRLAEHGFAEVNVSARLEAQWIALQTSFRHPLGVGFKNVRRATQWAARDYKFDTADSVYMDTLLGAGFAGLVALLWLFGASWALLTRLARGSRAGPILHAGVVAFLVFGLATVVPVSVFLAPLFFTIVSVGWYVDHSR